MYGRFLSVHDRTLSQLRTLRRDHATLLTESYSEIMRTIGEDISIVENVHDDYYMAMQSAVSANEAMTPCLESIQERYERKVRDVNLAIRDCSMNANFSMAQLTREIFYPVLDVTQQGHSLLPLAALSALSRANAMTEQFQVVDFLQTQFDLNERGWLENVLVSFDWERSQFDVRYQFLLELTNDCTGVEAVYFMIDVFNLKREINDCPAPPTLVPPPEEF